MLDISRMPERNHTISDSVYILFPKTIKNVDCKVQPNHCLAPALFCIPVV